MDTWKDISHVLEDGELSDISDLSSNSKQSETLHEAYLEDVSSGDDIGCLYDSSIDSVKGRSTKIVKNPPAKVLDDQALEDVSSNEDSLEFASPGKKLFPVGLCRNVKPSVLALSLRQEKENVSSGRRKFRHKHISSRSKKRSKSTCSGHSSSESVEIVHDSRKRAGSTKRCKVTKLSKKMEAKIQLAASRISLHPHIPFQPIGTKKPLPKVGRSISSAGKTALSTGAFVPETCLKSRLQTMLGSKKESQKPNVKGVVASTCGKKTQVILKGYETKHAVCGDDMCQELETGKSDSSIEEITLPTFSRTSNGQTNKTRKLNNTIKPKTIDCVSDSDLTGEDNSLEMLRQTALLTKSKKHLGTVSGEKEEDLAELRLQALRSAVLKRHCARKLKQLEQSDVPHSSSIQKSTGPAATVRMVNKVQDLDNTVIKLTSSPSQELQNLAVNQIGQNTGKVNTNISVDKTIDVVDMDLDNTDDEEEKCAPDLVTCYVPELWTPLDEDSGAFVLHNKNYLKSDSLQSSKFPKPISDPCQMYPENLSRDGLSSKCKSTSPLDLSLKNKTPESQLVVKCSSIKKSEAKSCPEKPKKVDVMRCRFTPDNGTNKLATMKSVLVQNFEKSKSKVEVNARAEMNSSKVGLDTESRNQKSLQRVNLPSVKSVVKSLKPESSYLIKSKNVIVKRAMCDPPRLHNVSEVNNIQLKSRSNNPSLYGSTSWPIKYPPSTLRSMSSRTGNLKWLKQTSATKMGKSPDKALKQTARSKTLFKVINTPKIRPESKLTEKPPLRSRFIINLEDDSDSDLEVHPKKMKSFTEEGRPSPAVKDIVNPKQSKLPVNFASSLPQIKNVIGHKKLVSPSIHLNSKHAPTLQGLGSQECQSQVPVDKCVSSSISLGTIDDTLDLPQITVLSTNESSYKTGLSSSSLKNSKHMVTAKSHHVKVHHTCEIPDSNNVGKDFDRELVLFLKTCRQQVDNDQAKAAGQTTKLQMPPPQETFVDRSHTTANQSSNGRPLIKSSPVLPAHASHASTVLEQNPLTIKTKQQPQNLNKAEYHVSDNVAHIAGSMQDSMTSDKEITLVGRSILSLHDQPSEGGHCQQLESLLSALKDTILKELKCKERVERLQKDLASALSSLKYQSHLVSKASLRLESFNKECIAGASNYETSSGSPSREDSNELDCPHDLSVWLEKTTEQADCMLPSGLGEYSHSSGNSLFPVCASQLSTNSTLMPVSPVTSLHPEKETGAMRQYRSVLTSSCDSSSLHCPFVLKSFCKYIDCNMIHKPEHTSDGEA